MPKPNLKRSTITKLRAVVATILKRPKNYGQNEWCSRVKMDKRGNICGTPSYLAGHVLFLNSTSEGWEKILLLDKYAQNSYSHNFKFNWVKEARDVLGLTLSQANFFSTYTGK